MTRWCRKLSGVPLKSRSAPSTLVGSSPTESSFGPVLSAFGSLRKALGSGRARRTMSVPCSNGRTDASLPGLTDSSGSQAISLPADDYGANQDEDQQPGRPEESALATGNPATALHNGITLPAAEAFQPDISSHRPSLESCREDGPGFHPSANPANRCQRHQMDGYLPTAPCQEHVSKRSTASQHITYVPDWEHFPDPIDPSRVVNWNSLQNTDDTSSQRNCPPTASCRPKPHVEMHYTQTRQGTWEAFSPEKGTAELRNPARDHFSGFSSPPAQGFDAYFEPGPLDAGYTENLPRRHNCSGYKSEEKSRSAFRDALV